MNWTVIGNTLENAKVKSFDLDDPEDSNRIIFQGFAKRHMERMARNKRKKN